jgi:RNA polymerase sigma-70 factor (ECF subfamily)
LRIKDPQNAAAWNQLMAIYRPVIYRLARRKGLLHEDAEDLVQGVFISIAKAIDRWEQGEGQPRFRNWLGRITRNAIVNAITRAGPDRATGTSSVLQSLASLPQGTESTQSLIVECRLEAIRWAAREIQSEFSNATWAIFQSIAIR